MKQNQIKYLNKEYKYNKNVHYHKKNKMKCLMYYYNN